MSALRPEALITWSPLDNLHITTKFIGDWPESRLDALHQVLTGLTIRTPFEVEVKGLGWFPSERAPRVLWAGVDAAEPLATLAKDTEERLLPLGIKPENRIFSPHLTLARIKRPVPLARLRQKVHEMEPPTLGKFLVSHFTLFRSDPGSNASIYRKVHQYQFETATSTS